MPIPLDDLASRGNLNLALKFIPAGSEGERGLWAAGGVWHGRVPLTPLARRSGDATHG